jgi:hypothetical protein
MDHSPADPTGKTYRGLAHGTVPCSVCGRKCNRSEAGRRGALMAGKQLRDRICVICGRPFVSRWSAVTCSQRACVTAIRASRKAHHPDPAPPPVDGWVW